MDKQHQPLEGSIEPGERVYDSDGRLLGHVSARTDEGFEIEPIDADGNDAEELPDQEFGKGFLMWRCDECGEMGDIDDGMPEECPACRAPLEAIEKVRED